MTNNFQNNESTSLVIIGFKTTTYFTRPDFYAILQYNEKEGYLPLAYKQQLLFFAKISEIDAINHFLNTTLNIQKPISTDIHMVCNIVKMFDLLANKKEDEDACILNNMKISMSMLKIGLTHIPIFYNRTLYHIVDHFTSDIDINKFIEKVNIDRVELVETIQWVIGAAISRGIFIPKRTIAS